MGFPLTKQELRRMCGRRAYEKGEMYCRKRSVHFTTMDHHEGVYQAYVTGSHPFTVTLEINRDGSLDAVCTCPTLSSYGGYCQHIAAVLIYLHERERDRLLATDGSATAGREIREERFDRNRQAAEDLLQLFRERVVQPKPGRTRFDTRETLSVEFTIKLSPYGYRQFMFGLEMKIGSKRLYIVQHIREFLERVMRGETYPFSSLFTYDPARHVFEPENEAILSVLIKLYQNEKMYRDSLGLHTSPAVGRNGERLLLIPPYMWDELLPLLQKAPLVKLVQGEVTYEGVHLSDEPLPLQFALEQERNDQTAGYRLNLDGVDQLAVTEAYGIVLYAGKLYRQPPESCRRLSKLKRIVDASGDQHIPIPPEKIDSFMQDVVPGLVKMGKVDIAETISKRIVQAALQAKLYLDRVKDRLVAGLEFQYGQVVIDPFQEKNGPPSPHILIRDSEKERHIVDLLEQSQFIRTEGGFFLEDEEAEYQFLYHVMPQLEKLAKIYATSAVKVRMHAGHVIPRVHVERKERTNWLEIRFSVDGIPEEDIRKLLQSVEEKRPYYRLPNGSFVPLEGEEFQSVERLMSELGIRHKQLAGGEIHVPLVQGLRLLDMQPVGQSVQWGKSFRRMLDDMRNPDNLEFPVPERLDTVLRDYQKYGYQWLRTLAHYGFGGILADDMGLGKTVQAIAFLVSMLPHIREQKKPALVVAPTSLVYNWLHELRKFAPEIRVMTVDGSKAERKRVYAELAQADVVITSYPLLRRDLLLVSEHAFHTLILDEAQFIKNHATQTAQAVKKLDAQYRFALTGTPVENRLEELWSIFDAVFPDLFPGRKAFHDMPREAVARRVKPFLLRRVKKDVLRELPDKIESLQPCDLLPEQKKLYMAYLAKLQQETLKHLTANDFQRNRIKILAGLTRLRQLCLHPGLFVEDYTGGSAKLEQLLEIVEECRAAGRRVLLFSQFTEMLGLIGRKLTEQGVDYFYLDGKTPGAERIQLCQRFNEGERDFFLISLKAGGTGLNLTGADTVILYDLWWNPAVEEQATDRAHRIGQRNVVQIIRLVTQGTVEEKMYELQQKKKHLIEEVIQPGQEALSTLTEDEIREILRIETN